MPSFIAEYEIPYKLFSIANKYEHWSNRARRVKKEQIIVNLYLQDIPPLPVKVILTRVASRRWDSDNLMIAFKNIRDAVAQVYFPKAPVGIMDETHFFNWEYGQRKGIKDEYKIIIRLETIHKPDINT